MTIVEAVDAVIVRHLGTSRFPPADVPELSGFWARSLIDASLNETLSFGLAADALAIEKLRRDVIAVLQGIETLSASTTRFTPTSRSRQAIVSALMGKEPGSIYQEASLNLHVLLDWVTEVGKAPAFRRQAKGGRNWRAASVAMSCRNLWGFAQWHILGKPSPSDDFLAQIATIGVDQAEFLQQEKAKFILNCAPRTEKHDAPGPFGRFLEDVLETLGIVGRDGHRLSAHSALRALSQAVSRNAQEK